MFDKIKSQRNIFYKINIMFGNREGKLEKNDKQNLLRKIIRERIDLSVDDKQNIPRKITRERIDLCVVLFSKTEKKVKRKIKI